MESGNRELKIEQFLFAPFKKWRIFYFVIEIELYSRFINQIFDSIFHRRYIWLPAKYRVGQLSW